MPSVITFIATLALAPLEPCATGSRAGRAGLCAEGSPVVLRGANYIRLDAVEHYHGTFAPDANFSRYAVALDHLRAGGFNIARVFVDGRVGSGIAGKLGAAAPIDLEYVERMARFITLAAARGIYSMVTLERLPSNGYFENLTRGIDPSHFGHGDNRFLAPAFVEAYVHYCELVAEALRERLGAKDFAAVLFSLQNEFSLRGDEPPFSDMHAIADTAAGRFAMDAARSRQQAADDNVVLWAERCRAALRTALPESLVTVGVFTFAAVGKPSGPDGLNEKWCKQPRGDCRFPARPAVLSRTSLDFLDVHIYQADGRWAALEANLASIEWDSINTSKPVMMGESGCLGGKAPGPSGAWYASAAACVPHVVRLQVSSCVAGFIGWLFWTFDTDTLSEQPQWYSMVDEHAAIGNALAPARRADPCASE